MAKKKGFAPVPPELLRAFGFKRITHAHGGYPKGTWKNAALCQDGLFYDPRLHTMRNFARNFVREVMGSYVRALYEECFRCSLESSAKVLRGGRSE